MKSTMKCSSSAQSSSVIPGAASAPRMTRSRSELQVQTEYPDFALALHALAVTINPVRYAACGFDREAVERD